METIAMPSTKTMTRLAAAAAKLNNKTDELNAVIREFEETLANMGVGLALWLDDLLDETDSEIDYDGNDQVYTKTGWELGFGKLDGGWRLAVREVMLVSHFGHYDADDLIRRVSKKPVALTNAPRLIRVQAAELFEDLATALARQLEDYAKTIEAAKEMAKVEPKPTNDEQKSLKA